MNFGGLTSSDLVGVEPRYSILPVPYDLTVSYMAGARNGPGAIIEASSHMELYDEELGTEPFRAGIETLPFVEPTTKGPEAMIERVEAAASDILDSDRVPVLLGGEHSVTLGLVRALKKRYQGLSVLQLDAHADMRDSYQESPFNHACVARRISELCPIVQAGIRSLSREEADFLGSDGAESIKTYYAADVMERRPWDEIASGLGEEVFVTIDLDVFDPSIMPSTGTPEPGGLGWYDVLRLLKTVTEKRRVVGFDVVELCPIPGIKAPDFLAARLVYKMMGYMNASTH